MTFTANLPAMGSLHVRGPQHSGDKTCMILATVMSYADQSSGARLEAHELDALISTLQALRHLMR